MERDFDILMREFIQEAQEKEASDEKTETTYRVVLSNCQIQGTDKLETGLKNQFSHFWIDLCLFWAKKSFFKNFKKVVFWLFCCQNVILSHFRPFP